MAGPCRRSLSDPDKSRSPILTELAVSVLFLHFLVMFLSALPSPLPPSFVFLDSVLSVPPSLSFLDYGCSLHITVGVDRAQPWCPGDVLPGIL